MTQKERMLAGLPYKAWLDGLYEERLNCKRKIYEFNLISPDEYTLVPQKLKEIFGKTGDTLFIEAPFHCDYGWNIEVGNNFFCKP